MRTPTENSAHCERKVKLNIKATKIMMNFSNWEILANGSGIALLPWIDTCKIKYYQKYLATIKTGCTGLFVIS